MQFLLCFAKFYMERILFKSHGDFKKQDARLDNRTRWDNPTTSYDLQQYDSSDGCSTELLSS